MSRVKRRRPRRFKMPEINLTPLIDTMLTLLIIFIITTPIVQNGIKVDLPQGKSKEVGSQQDMVISINKNKEIFFNSYPVTLKTLVKTVQKSLKQQRIKTSPVYVKADTTVPYGEVIKVVDALKQANVKSVAMSTRPT